MPHSPPNSAAVRAALVRALRLDLVGPGPGADDAAHQSETLPAAPSRYYLTGFLVPHEAPESHRGDAASDGDPDELAAASPGDDGGTPEATSARKAFFPASLGLSVLVPAGLGQLTAHVTWGDYVRRGGAAPNAPPLAAPEAAAAPDGAGARDDDWLRRPREACAALDLPAETAKPLEFELAESDGLWLVVSVRPAGVPGAAPLGVPAGTRAVSVFLVNRRTPAPRDDVRDTAFVFQAVLALEAQDGFVARPDPRGGGGDDDWDEHVAGVQYRDHVEYVVGHNVSAVAERDAAGVCRRVRSEWLPETDVEKVLPADVPEAEFGMEALAAAPTAAAVQAALQPLLAAYETWTAAQPLPAEPAHRRVAETLLDRAARARGRMAAGLAALDDPAVLLAFQITNRVMARAIRQRGAEENAGRPDDLAPPRWRAFQLAFVLMNLVGLAEPGHRDRERVDLLFFPTGGGKTEAYLGLAAFALVLRRLRNPGLASAGVAVLMRYTLRLLTLDQLGRAATLICALELERQADPQRLGPWPFEIGLWVGQAATPNRMGQKGDPDPDTARARTLRFQADDRRHPAPIPLETCPWCGTKFKATSFQLGPNADKPHDLRVVCTNRRCRFTGDNSLPIVAVDEPLYRRLPGFVIATVDKFASLPWVAQTGALFGKVERYDANGFYGPSEPGMGQRLAAPLLPPELIIQDELHLISGPLGTLAGLYETALGALAARPLGDRTVGPKIVASTATVRRAEAQIRALFGRAEVDVFPPPGPDRRDSFFARTVATTERPGRRYVGVAAPGRSLKVVLLRTYLALLGAAEKAWQAAGGAQNATNPADPYMTLVGYFNSLRELGGSRRIVEDEVVSRLPGYGERRRVGEAAGLFAERHIQNDQVELTSRVATNAVAETKRRLALPFADKQHVDVALATNMISVGLDIARLGLMVVLGQPKAAAEYIQATSRVGRDDRRPGLVVALLNVHRPRDRSHYERFVAWHDSFYRAVEATSVTPFSPRAVDRGLAAVVVALARHGRGELTPPRGALEAGRLRGELDFVAEALARRAEGHDKEQTAAEAEALRTRIRGRALDLLDLWAKLAEAQRAAGAGLQYQREVGGDPPLLRDPLDPEGGRFRAGRSLRDVEPSVPLWVRTPEGQLQCEAPAEESRP